MENENQIQEQPKPNKNKFRLVVLSIIGLLIILGYSMFLGISSYKEKDAESTKNKADYMSMLLKYQHESRYSDSLFRVNMRFDKYRYAAESQAYRDSVSRRLEYNPGDFAYKKLDSSKVLIIETIIGGGTYDYYFRYRIMDSTGKESEIKPELLFDKK